MTNLNSNQKAFTTKKVFSRETSVSINIESETSILWALLINSNDYPRWNSTIISIDGDIKVNGIIALKSKLDPKRTFKLKIKSFISEKQMIWGDAMGNRVYTIKDLGNGIINFTMSEKIGGPLFPLFAKMIPSFDQSFDQFAHDLKLEAETISKTK